MNIDEALRELCIRHEFTTISVGYHTALTYPFTVYAHWGNVCATGGGSSISEALSEAIIEANERRAVPPSVPEIEMEMPE